ncbi:hypothetical protein V500_03559 [Pseudogymnoascus sp. VKM F-4518 (FW-2643)]|nr:hypothetical protein V500_03559 [Pseudogymnoascus sp. VKM F-4518 (FW-2643)]
MPLTEVKPRALEWLKKDVQASPPEGRGDLIVGNVMRQFGGKAAGSYRHTLNDETTDVDIANMDSCLVYVLVGRITVGEQEITQDKLGEAEVAYLIEDVKTITVHKATAIVIFCR